MYFQSHPGMLLKIVFLIMIPNILFCICLICRLIYLFVDVCFLPKNLALEIKIGCTCLAVVI